MQEIREGLKGVSVDIDYLTRAYFYFDKPVNYKLDKGEILIRPVELQSSEIFLSSVGILNIDKNSIPNPQIIQMSYLQFLAEVVFHKDSPSLKTNLQQLLNIFILCLDLKAPMIKYNDFKKPYIYDELTGMSITPKQFDEIRQIILYQNIYNYDDSYVNPDLKKSMQEQDELKNRNIETPNLERKIAIITAHSGLPKREQELMTYRSHCVLFDEVCGEVEFTTVRPVALFSDGGKNLEHWIYKHKKDKFDGYIKSVDSYTNSMGGSQAMRTTDVSLGGSYMEQFNNFNK